MAGSTTNIGLIKPTYSEDADVAIINENMDTLDSTISALDNGLAIVSNNNTHGAITAGQYVYVRNHGSLAEGMYTANSNIAANATLSSSNLTAVSSGSLNNIAKSINTDGAINLSSYTAKSLIDSIVANGNKIYYCSASSGNKLSDLPITQAGVYIVRADTYYKSLDFMGTNGYDYHYDYTGNSWTSLNDKITKRPISEIVYVSGETSSSGIIEINITNIYNYAFCVTNVSKGLTYPYSVTVESWNNSTGKLNLRIRNMGDNSAVANTSVGFDVMIIGTGT